MNEKKAKTQDESERKITGLNGESHTTPGGFGPPFPTQKTKFVDLSR